MRKEPQRAQSLFLSRDESWLSFNRRVLEEAEDASNPLLERVKFLAITASNLDEFFEIRIAGVLQRIEDGYNEATPDGATLRESLDAMKDETQRFVADQYRCWNQELLPAMRKSGIRVLTWDEMNADARKFASDYYQREVDPLLTPITIDPAHPFPRVLNKAMCLALLQTTRHCRSRARRAHRPARSAALCAHPYRQRR
jgi:polyphosphate kinase